MKCVYCRKPAKEFVDGIECCATHAVKLKKADAKMGGRRHVKRVDFSEAGQLRMKLLSEGKLKSKS